MLSSVIRLVLFSLFLCLLSADGRAQVSIKGKVGATIFDSIILDIETDMRVTFTDEAVGSYVVDPELRVGEDALLEPARIRITGYPVEIMVDIEVEDVVDPDGGDIAVSVSNFNLLQENAGSSVTVMPYSDENSFLLFVGGTVSGVRDLGKSYTGLNVLNINYL